MLCYKRISGLLCVFAYILGIFENNAGASEWEVSFDDREHFIPPCTDFGDSRNESGEAVFPWVDEDQNVPGPLTLKDNNQVSCIQYEIEMGGGGLLTVDVRMAGSCHEMEVRIIHRGIVILNETLPYDTGDRADPFQIISFPLPPKLFEIKDVYSVLVLCKPICKCVKTPEWLTLVDLHGIRYTPPSVLKILNGTVPKDDSNVFSSKDLLYIMLAILASFVMLSTIYLLSAWRLRSLLNAGIFK